MHALSSTRTQKISAEKLTKPTQILHDAAICVTVMFAAQQARGCSSMVEPLPSKQIVRVRFSSSAPSSDSCSGGIRAFVVSTQLLDDWSRRSLWAVEWTTAPRNETLYAGARAMVKLTFSVKFVAVSRE